MAASKAIRCGAARPIDNEVRNMIKRIFNFKAKAGLAVAVVAALLALGVTPVMAEFDVAPDTVEFERISVQSEQMLIESGFMDRTEYGWCRGWSCRKATDCGSFCFCQGGYCDG